MNDIKNNIIEKVTARIASGEVHMRSRALFILKSFAIVALGFVALLASILIINFILFSIHFNSHDTLLNFGPRGWVSFLTFFPWPLLIIDILCIGGLSILLKQFRFGYKTPLLYVFGGIIIFAILCGFTLERHTPTNDFFMRGVEGDMIPGPMKGVMGGMRKPPSLEDGICGCEIVEVVSAEQITLREIRSGKTFTALVNSGSYDVRTPLIPGDKVFVAGEFKDNTFTIFGLKKVDGRGPFHGQMMQE